MAEMAGASSIQRDVEFVVNESARSGIGIRVLVNMGRKQIISFVKLD